MTTTEDRVGLCVRCTHARNIQSSKGSEFLLCGLAARDPRFKKYPPIPVRSCSGFKEKAARAESG